MRTTTILSVLAVLLSCFLAAQAVRNYAGALQYARTHPTRDGGTWLMWCAALMVRAGDLPDWAIRPSAIAAYRDSRVVSKDYNAAPPGAFHWWDITQWGHVGMSMGGGKAFMASSQLQEVWGQGIGAIMVAEYNRRTGARYLGWSYDYAGARLAGVGGNSAPVPQGVPLTATVHDGVPGPNFYMRLQLFASKNGYSGPIDGVMGVNSWKGVQTGLRAYGYSGPVDGVPGKNTYIAMQVLASRHGYQGPQDGALGPNSYKALSRFLNTL